MSELQEERLQNFPHRTFVTYRGMRIFYEFSHQWQQWFVSVNKIGKEAQRPGYPTLGSHWFESKQECIHWGKCLIDAERNGDTKTKNYLVLNNLPPH